MISKYNHDEINSFVQRLSQKDRKDWTQEDLDKIEDYSKYIDSFTHNNPHPEDPNHTNMIKDFNESDHRGDAMYTSPEFDKHIQYQIERATHKNVQKIGNMEVYDNPDYYHSNPLADPAKEHTWWKDFKKKISSYI